MRQGEASSTARVIAAATLLLAGDPRSSGLVAPGAAGLCRRFLARRRMDRLLAWSVSNPAPRALWRMVERLTHPGILAHYWHRKRWIEARCRTAVAQGFSRIIVLGAGFDTLACRMAAEFPRTDWIEVDHPATQACKREALDGEPASIRMIALDLGRQGLAGLVVGERDTLVIMEGVLMYLQEEQIDRLFATLQGLPARRLRIIFSFMTRWPDGTCGFRPRSRAVHWWLRRRAEPFTWALPPQSMPEFTARHGLRLIEMALTREISRGASRLDGENLVLCESRGGALCVA